MCGHVMFLICCVGIVLNVSVCLDALMDASSGEARGRDMHTRSRDKEGASSSLTSNTTGKTRVCGVQLCVLIFTMMLELKGLQ